MTVEAVGSESWLARVFDADVRDDLFIGHAPGCDEPVLVLLGGQPAAGKTRAQGAILDEHITDGLVEITGDDLREYRPDYRRLSWDDPFLMPALTAPVSGGLVKVALDHAFDHRYSVLLEGTFREATMVTGTAARFGDAGYRVEVVAVATPASVSRLSKEERSLSGGYPKIGRWTPPEAHEVAVEQSGFVLAELEASPQVSRVQVFSREGVLYENARTDAGEWQNPARGAEVLRAEQNSSLSMSEALDWLRNYAAVFERAMLRPGYLGRETAATYYRLQRNAQDMIGILGQGHAVVSAQRAQDARHAQLMRLISPQD